MIDVRIWASPSTATPDWAGLIESSTSRFLASNVAAAGTDSRPAELGYGRAMVVLSGTAIGTMQIRLDGTGAGETVYELTLAAAGRVTQEIVLPRIQSYVVITNTSGAVNSYRGRIIQQTEPN